MQSDKKGGRGEGILIRKKDRIVKEERKIVKEPYSEEKNKNVTRTQKAQLIIIT